MVAKASHPSVHRTDQPKDVRRRKVAAAARFLISWRSARVATALLRHATTRATPTQTKIASHIPHEANVERVMWALKDRFPLHFIVFKRISRNSSMRTSRAAEILKGSLWHYTIILLPVSHPASSACAEHQLTELFILPQYS